MKSLLWESLRFFLGLQIRQAKEETFSQTKYALKLLKKFEMQDSKLISTLLVSALEIDKDEHTNGKKRKKKKRVVG